MRLVALDVLDHMDTRRKEIRCFQPGGQSGGSDAGRVHSVTLTGDWYDTEVAGGDVLHVLDICSDETDDALWTEESEYVVSNSSGLLVVHPELLISPTRIAEACGCVRRSVLSERVRSLSGPNTAAVLGKVKHDFVEALIEQVLPRVRAAPRGSHSHTFTPSAAEVAGLVYQSISNNAEELWYLGLTDQLADQLKVLVPQVVRWLEQWCQRSKQGTPTTVTEFASTVSAAARTTPVLGGNLAEKWKPAHPSLLEVGGVEESVLSSVLGIRGQLDLVMRGAVADGPPGSQRSVLLPVELKTGKRSPTSAVMHRAQVMLYVLMLRLRGSFESTKEEPSDASSSLPSYPVQQSAGPAVGLLLYLSDAGGLDVEVVSPSWAELRNLMQARNSQAIHLLPRIRMHAVPRSHRARDGRLFRRRLALQVRPI